MGSPDDIVVVAAVRTPITRAKKGAFKDTTPDVLLATVLRTVLERTGVMGEDLGEICVGNVLQHGAGAAGSRMAQMMAGIPHTVPLSTVNRQCSSGLQAVANVASGIRSGFYDIGIAAGVECMSLASMSGSVPQVNWDAVNACREAKDCTIPMGITSENVAAKYGVSRQEQDAFAAASHTKAHTAQQAGKFREEIVPVTTYVKDKDGALARVTVDADEGIRPGTNAEALAKLKPAFKAGGSTTAGNSSQVSDGAAAVLLASRRRAAQLGLKVLGVFRGFAVAGVPPAVMGVGPAFAIPAVLRQTGVSKDDVDVYEINEAFASQALYCIRELGLDPLKVNPNGGAIALGHPLGCTGARQVATLLHELWRTGGHIGVVSMCIGTGMGAAAVFEKEPVAAAHSRL
ncbi:Thiolase, N-terminal domain-containing protein [Tribonema minus]|uniref:acetyl-CoA C-acyltransferase n=1 Tax=Tribonema minus TaxID=303371 RepID=A0A836CLM1_9STRA|nr:Thiolase, N-terminal domain-containing protein [Tribonema minus]